MIIAAMISSSQLLFHGADILETGSMVCMQLCNQLSSDAQITGLLLCPNAAQCGLQCWQTKWLLDSLLAPYRIRVQFGFAGENGCHTPQQGTMMSW